MAVDLELQTGETMEQEMKGDYWKKLFLIMFSQTTGRYFFTNKRIVFRGGFATELDLAYQDIAEIKKCNVGPLIGFIPTGIKVIMKDGKVYRLSVLGRNKVMETIQDKLS